MAGFRLIDWLEFRQHGVSQQAIRIPVFAADSMLAKNFRTMHDLRFQRYVRTMAQH